MKVAVLADIHANIAALDRVLSDVRSAGIERLILLGDFVGYYYEPKAVVDALRDFDCIGIQGNHDRMALEARTDESVLEDYRARYGSGLDAVFEQFGDAEWDWLAQHPVTRDIALGERRIRLAHGAPFAPDAYIYPDAEAGDFARVCDEFGGDAIWLGHTHYPFERPGPPAIMNPGSVGQPRDIGGLAAWAIYHPETAAVAFRRTEFPVVDTLTRCRERDPLHDRLANVLTRNRIGGGL